MLSGTIELRTYDGCRLWAHTTDDVEAPAWGTAVIADRDLPDDAAATPTESIFVRCYIHEDGTVMIPEDCQSDPSGEVAWVEARTGADAIILGGAPRILEL